VRAAWPAAATRRTVRLCGTPQAFRQQASCRQQARGLPYVHKSMQRTVAGRHQAVTDHRPAYSHASNEWKSPAPARSIHLTSSPGGPDDAGAFRVVRCCCGGATVARTVLHDMYVSKALVHRALCMCLHLRTIGLAAQGVHGTGHPE
jgi:hypothetical protein